MRDECLEIVRYSDQHEKKRQRYLGLTASSFKCLAQASAVLCLPCAELSLCTEYAYATSPDFMFVTLILASSFECQLPMIRTLAAPAFLLSATPVISYSALSRS